MKSSDVIPDEAKDQFWLVVSACLQAFHKGRGSNLLLKALSRLRKKVAHLPCEDMELFYHSEPFDVACRLAQRDLDVKNHLEEYVQIREQIYNAAPK